MTAVVSRIPPAVTSETLASPVLLPSCRRHVATLLAGPWCIAKYHVPPKPNIMHTGSTQLDSFSGCPNRSGRLRSQEASIISDPHGPSE